MVAMQLPFSGWLLGCSEWLLSGCYVVARVLWTRICDITVYHWSDMITIIYFNPSSRVLIFFHF